MTYIVVRMCLAPYVPIGTLTMDYTPTKMCLALTTFYIFVKLHLTFYVPIKTLATIYILVKMHLTCNKIIHVSLKHIPKSIVPSK